jgi:hypothetical protein
LFEIHLLSCEIQDAAGAKSGIDSEYDQVLQVRGTVLEQPLLFLGAEDAKHVVVLV